MFGILWILIASIALFFSSSLPPNSSHWLPSSWWYGPCSSHVLQSHISDRTWWVYSPEYLQSWHRGFIRRIYVAWADPHTTWRACPRTHCHTLEPPCDGNKANCFGAVRTLAKQVATECPLVAPSVKLECVSEGGCRGFAQVLRMWTAYIRQWYCCANIGCACVFAAAYICATLLRIRTSHAGLDCGYSFSNWTELIGNFCTGHHTLLYVFKSILHFPCSTHSLDRALLPAFQA